MKKVNIKYLFLLITIYILIFQNLLQNLFKPIKYYDEILALLLIPLLIFRMLKHKKNDIKIKKTTIFMIFLMSMIFFVGIISNILYQYQPLEVYWGDALLIFKFFFVYFLSENIWKNGEIVNKYSEKIYKHTRLFLSFLFIATILNYIFKMWPWEYRWGIMSNKLFYDHPTILAATCVFLLVLLILTQKYKKIDLAICAFILVSTLRLKAIGTACVIAIIIYWVNKKNKKISISKFMILGIILMVLAWDQIIYYYLGNEDTARNQLTIKSIEIARDHFPIGTGFGTYASYLSGKNYSPIYSMYDLDNIWGLEEKNPIFVSDTFWPMIIGQFGIIGTLSYVMCLIIIFKRIQMNFSKENKNVYLAQICCFVYLIISSTSEAAFVHPTAIPLAIILGL